MADDEPLDPSVEALVLADLPADQCINGWTTTPVGDLVVFLIDRGLRQTIAPYVASAGDRHLGCGRTYVFRRKRNRWERVSIGGWGQRGPIMFLRFYKAVALQQPRLALKGFQLCDRWFDLDSRSAAQSEVNEMLAAFDADPSPCPVWLEMRRQFMHWARSRGFAVKQVLA